MLIAEAENQNGILGQEGPSVKAHHILKHLQVILHWVLHRTAGGVIVIGGTPRAPHFNIHNSELSCSVIFRNDFFVQLAQSVLGAKVIIGGSFQRMFYVESSSLIISMTVISQKHVFLLFLFLYCYLITVVPFFPLCPPPTSPPHPAATVNLTYF